MWYRKYRAVSDGLLCCNVQSCLHGDGHTYLRRIACLSLYLQDSSNAGSPTEETIEILEDSGDDVDRDSAGEEIIASDRDSDTEIRAKNGISVSVRRPSLIMDEPSTSHATIRTTVSVPILFQ